MSASAHLLSLSPWLIRMVCVVSLVALFLTKNLRAQGLLSLLLFGGAVFCHKIGETLEDGISVPRRIVAVALLTLALTGTINRFWILTVLLVLAFFQFS